MTRAAIRLLRGGVSEWPKEAALKAARCQKPRGFESLRLRQHRPGVERAGPRGFWRVRARLRLSTPGAGRARRRRCRRIPAQEPRSAGVPNTRRRRPAVRRGRRRRATPAVPPGRCPALIRRMDGDVDQDDRGTPPVTLPSSRSSSSLPTTAPLTVMPRSRPPDDPPRAGGCGRPLGRRSVSPAGRSGAWSAQSSVSCARCTSSPIPAVSADNGHRPSSRPTGGTVAAIRSSTRSSIQRFWAARDRSRSGSVRGNDR